ncbi:MAG: adenosylcobinamide-GDP ribazoletransferase [Desulfovibrio sp.]|nr:adenosylcobinamide-GDP ribazoletransferase [Desulfovibrio sp.]
MAFWTRLAVALSFLTCVVSVRTDAKTLQESVAAFGWAGLCIGCLCLCPSIPVCAFISPYAPLLAGWVWLCVAIGVSGGMHWDGLADVADGLGSRKQGEEFWRVVHDSSLGTFGVLALGLVGIGQWLCVSIHCEHKDWLVLLVAPMWGRLAPIWLAQGHCVYSGSKTAHFLAEALQKNPWIGRRFWMLFWALPLGLCFVLDMPGLLCLYPAQYGLLVWLRRVAASYGGISGDFLGASVELSVLCFLGTSLVQ